MKKEAPERIWAARDLISNGELAGPFNVPPHLRYLCVEYICADLHQREIKHLREVLKAVTDALANRCEALDDWCGLPSCAECGYDAVIVAAARELLVLKEGG